jgi:probable HAF family extracellular repeat protein
MEKKLWTIVLTLSVLLGMVGMACANQGFLYSNGTITYLGLPRYQGSEALGINNSGQIVGEVTDVSGFGSAFLYSNGTMTDLGTLPGFYSSDAVCINDLGQIVGMAYTPSELGHAFLYSDGTWTDLGILLGDECSYASGINYSGEIVGYTYPYSPFVPLPPTVILLASGLLGLAGWRRFRKG